MRIISPQKGYSKNPLENKKYRNLACPCGCGKKTKKCLGIPLYIPEVYARYYQACIDGNKEKANEILEEIKKSKNE